MTAKRAGWIIIGIAIVLGILRLLHIISTNLTAVLFMLGVFFMAGVTKGFTKGGKAEAKKEKAEG